MNELTLYYRHTLLYLYIIYNHATLSYHSTYYTLFNYSYLGQDEESWGIIFADASTDIWRLEHGGSSGDISGATTMANGGTMNLALDLEV